MVAFDARTFIADHLRLLHPERSGFPGERMSRIDTRAEQPGHWTGNSQLILPMPRDQAKQPWQSALRCEIGWEGLVTINRRTVIASALTAPFLRLGAASGRTYDQGVSATEIKLGQTTAYSGPVSGAASMKRVQVAYFDKLSAEGGINGRKVSLISLDDGYSPPKTVEVTRKLVESDEVFAIFNSFGTPTSAAVQRYLNIKKVPQLFVSSGAARFNDPVSSPWSCPALPDLQGVGTLYSRFILNKFPGAKIAILFQNDDFGKDMVRGVKQGLGSQNANMVIKEVSYESTEPTIDSQIVTVKSSGADLFINLSTGRATVQSIKRVFEIGWKPVHIVNGAFGTIFEVFRPAGLEKTKDIYSSAFVKDPADPTWFEDSGMVEYFEFMKKYMPDVGMYNRTSLSSYVTAQAMAHVIKLAGDDVTRANVMRIATSLTDLRIRDLLMPGVTINTTPEKRNLFGKEVMAQFNGERWDVLGDF
jgi:branched-chain amino acid transport system substrate-binding protein